MKRVKADDEPQHVIAQFVTGPAMPCLCPHPSHHCPCFAHAAEGAKAGAQLDLPLDFNEHHLTELLNEVLRFA